MAINYPQANSRYISAVKAAQESGKSTQVHAGLNLNIFVTAKKAHYRARVVLGGHEHTQALCKPWDVMGADGKPLPLNAAALPLTREQALTLARAFAEKEKARIRPSTEKSPDLSGRLVRDFAPEYFEHKRQRVTPLTLSVFKSILTYAVAFFGDFRVNTQSLSIPNVLKRLRLISGDGADLKFIKERYPAYAFNVGLMPTPQKKLISFLNGMCQWALTTGDLTSNPLAGMINNRELGLPQTEKGHFPAPDAEKLRALVFEPMNGIGAFYKVLFLFSILAMTRERQAIATRWEWIDFERGIIVFPASAMKIKRPHTVFMSTQLIRLLKYWKAYGGAPAPCVFPSTRSGLGHIGYVQPQSLIAKLCDPALVSWHGVNRATPDTWLNEHSTDRLAIDLCLAHEPRGAIEQAYNRATFEPRRRAVTQQWGDFVETQLPAEWACLLGAQE